MNIVLCHEDLQFYLDQWPDNPCATPAQRASWPGKIAHEALAVDYEKPLVSLKQDGGDGRPVGDVKSGTVARFWCNDENHLCPSERLLVRFGRFFGLELERDLSLVLKSQWERDFAKVSGWEDWADTLFDSLRNEERAREHTVGFQPGRSGTLDADALFDLYEEHGGWASSAGYDRERFGVLINQAILTNCHLLGIGSRELDAFVKSQRDERALLKSANAEQEDSFWRLKLMWVEAENTLKSELWELENQRYENTRTEQRWMAEFGELYLRATEAHYSVLSLQRQIQIKQLLPELTPTEVEAEEAEAARQEQERLKMIRDELEIASPPPGPSAGFLPGQDASDYLSECQRVLFRINFLTHPDRVDRQNFTQAQKDKLLEYFQRAKALRSSEVSPDRDHRTLGRLLDILACVKAVWETMGIDIDEQRVIRGETLAEQQSWLEQAIVRLEGMIEEARNERFVLTHDEAAQEKAETLASEEWIEETKRYLEEMAKEYEGQIPVLKAELDALFVEEANR